MSDITDEMGGYMGDGSEFAQPTQDPKSEMPTDTTVACSDCNTNAHTWLTCPNRYPTPATKPLDEQIYKIVDQLIDVACDYEQGEDVDLDAKANESYHAIKALIADQVREELTNLKIARLNLGTMTTDHADGYQMAVDDMNRHIDERLQQLNTDKENR